MTCWVLLSKFLPRVGGWKQDSSDWAAKGFTLLRVLVGEEEEEEKKRKRRRTRLKIMTRLWTWWIMVIDNLADEMIQNKAALIEQQKDSHFSECSLRRRNRKRRWERDKAADKSVGRPRWPAAKVSSLLHLLLLVLVEGEKEAGERGLHWTDRVPAWLEKKSASGLGNLTRHWTTMWTKCWTSRAALIE